LANGFGPLLAPIDDLGGANFLSPPSFFIGAAPPGLADETPLIDKEIFSPYFSEKSFIGALLSFIS